ncbi:MAG: DUF1800 domain-containing protein [Marinibacterium profundimaris]
MRALTYSPDLADIRFGCGLSPVLAPPRDAQALLDGVLGPDTMAGRFPIESFETFNTRVQGLRDARAALRKAGTQETRKARREVIRKISRAANNARADWAARTLLRWTHTETGFRERLVAFWADHFTTVGKSALLRYANSAFVESAIRPHVGGTFPEMLIAATTHPVMLDYLDQTASVGPNSPAAARRERLSGMNENLAREVMELHTLGVDGPYTQQDVREFAELLTGLTYRPDRGLAYLQGWAEPGAETVLGKTYGAEPRLAHIHEALTDLALHPSTADHIARKLAVHFVNDDPDPDLVAHLSARYRASGGDLPQVYAALLEHPAAWAPRLSKVKPPLDFMGSALRALGVAEAAVSGLDFPAFRLTFFVPMSLMGQPWKSPSGPDGWPEEEAAWITPQSLSARLRWAMAVPQTLCDGLPDPRDFVGQALGGFATEPVRFAASAAESRSEAIGLVLCSPAFQRR